MARRLINSTTMNGGSQRGSPPMAREMTNWCMFSMIAGTVITHHHYYNLDYHRSCVKTDDRINDAFHVVNDLEQHCIYDK